MEIMEGQLWRYVGWDSSLKNTIDKIIPISDRIWIWNGRYVDRTSLLNKELFEVVPEIVPPPLPLTRLARILRDNPHLGKGKTKMDAIACIGSRLTPENVLVDMIGVARTLSEKYWIRTGAATGADQAFAIGNPVKTILYLPWGIYEETWRRGRDWKIGCTEPSAEAMTLAGAVHPNWDACGRGARALHGRNAHIILGKNLDSPVKFVVFWAEERGGVLQGGTALGVRLAEINNIPCVNMNKPGWKNAIALLSQ